jgi:hypothetical protein
MTEAVEAPARADRTARPPITREKSRETREKVTSMDKQDDGQSPVRKLRGLEFRHPVTGEILTREVYALDRSPYDIPKDLWPQGMIYEWKRKSVYGQADDSNILALKRNGWRDVPSDRHPDRSVEIEGLVLMECPEIFVEEGRNQERRKARAELTGEDNLPLPGGFSEREAGLRKAQFTRRGAPEAVDPASRPTYKYSLDE